MPSKKRERMRRERDSGRSVVSFHGARTRSIGGRRRLASLEPWRLGALSFEDARKSAVLRLRTCNYTRPTLFGQYIAQCSFTACRGGERQVGSKSMLLGHWIGDRCLGERRSVRSVLAALPCRAVHH